MATPRTFWFTTTPKAQRHIENSTVVGDLPYYHQKHATDEWTTVRHPAADAPHVVATPTKEGEKTATTLPEDGKNGEGGEKRASSLATPKQQIEDAWLEQERRFLEGLPMEEDEMWAVLERRAENRRKVGEEIDHQECEGAEKHEPRTRWNLLAEMDAARKRYPKGAKLLKRIPKSKA
ncbi:hypothetical protein EJ07DRAFT_179236 [Lizonia empirigonia]|nr:hypothetical protein EJ07DRAFT_179236 [Lizonia empirigonia]